MYNKELTFSRYPQLAPCRESMEEALNILDNCVRNGGKILLCGNGGSAADCNHIAGECLKGFLKKRSLSQEEKAGWIHAYGDAGAVLADKLQGGICAIDLTSFPAPISAVTNDTDAQLTYAQLVWAMGRPGDVLVGLSTSGNAKNVIYAAQAAKQRGMQVISLTGKKESPLSALANSAIRVPEQETYMVQELHLPVYHWLCAALEDMLFE